MALRATVAPEGAGRYDHADPEQGTIDLEPHMELFMTTGSTRRKQYDLYEELQDEKFIEHADLLEFFICAMNDYSTCGAFSDLRGRWDKRLTEHLLDKLADSEIVRDKALEYAEEEREMA